MLDADMNVRYWGHLARRYSSREKFIKIFLAVFSTSGAVASLSLWESVPYLWKGLVSISAIVAIALPILNYSDLVEKIAVQRGKWARLLSEYERLWSRVYADPNTAIEPDFQKLQDSIPELTQSEATLPHDDRLLRSCQTEVLKSRGIQSRA
jgi:hypothetical protein